MGRPIHFEIHAADVERAKAFYAACFGWTYQDWSDYAGMPYFGAITGEEGTPGIDGAIMQRHGDNPEHGLQMNGWVMTIGVEDYDTTHDAIMANGGTVAMPKMAMPGMAWQGYYIDTEGNTIGIHQPDENAA